MLDVCEKTPVSIEPARSVRSLITTSGENTPNIDKRESSEQHPFTTQTFRGRTGLSLEIRSGRDRVFHTVTMNFLSPEARRKEESVLEFDFDEYSTHIVLLREADTGEIVGFTYAKPYDQRLLQKNEKEMAQLGIDEKTYLDIYKNHTVEVGWTLIMEEYRHKGGWTQMMAELERSLKTNPQIQYMARTVREADNYALKVKRRYGPKIVYEDTRSYPEMDGPQQYYLIKL